MESVIISFTANQQELRICPKEDFAINSVSYIEAHFDLGENWDGFDSVRAVWVNGVIKMATVIDSLGNCIVPHEVLENRGKVMVNLVGSIADGQTLTDRLTTAQIVAFNLPYNALVDGDNTEAITPSQFEQFVATVKADADRAEAGASEAEGFADEAEEWADRAEQASANAGYMFFHIDENGHLIYERTPNTQVDFYLLNGDLYVEAIDE